MARILLVEDEAPLLHLLQKYLARSGHEVAACATAAKAWEIFDAEPERFPVVVADLTLPDGSGVELVRRMSERNENLSAIICSGYPLDLRTLGLAATNRGVVLQKPFLPHVLGGVVDTLLAETEPLHDPAESAC